MTFRTVVGFNGILGTRCISLRYVCPKCVKKKKKKQWPDILNYNGVASCGTNTP